MIRASYSVNRVTTDSIMGKTVFIIDKDVGMSITNDAENVVVDVLAQFPDHRIIYRDTSGQWDELSHWNGQFCGFKPYSM
jgi:hypothetical protein